MLLEGRERDAEATCDYGRALAVERSDDSVGVLRLVERTVADAERLLRLGEVVA